MVSILCKALKSDGSIHRYCEAEMELRTEQGCVVWTRLGTPVYDGQKVLYEQDAHVRTFFVYGARLNLLEIYEPNNQLREIYLNIIAPMEDFDSELLYVDLELDVSKIQDKGPALIVDEDEFEEAIRLYNYGAEVVSGCWTAAKLGQEVANCWEIGKESDEALSIFSNSLRVNHA
jgi:protein associated with RNAse G/E